MKKTLKRQVKLIMRDGEEQKNTYSKPSYTTAGIIVIFSVTASLLLFPSKLALAAENPESAHNPQPAAMGEKLPYSDAFLNDVMDDMMERSSSDFVAQTSSESISSAIIRDWLLTASCVPTA